jgi:CDP-diacylglycerol--serine O-phosphatidyltransferase
MQDQSRPRRRPRRGIYLLPNLFTTATLFGGFYAIVAALSGRYSESALAILVAMVADALDGRIARLTNTASDFGKEYDSLCDMVAFGVATGVLVYAYSLQHFADYQWLGGKLGWVIAFAFVACTAMRLARFNVLTNIAGGKGDFFGLPSPAAAAVLVFYTWSVHSWGLSGETLLPLTAVLTLGIALMMVSSVRYPSFKGINLTGRVRFVSFAAVVGALALVMVDPPRILFLLFFAYALSGPVAALAGRRLRLRPLGKGGSGE